MLISNGHGLHFKRLSDEDLSLLEKWYGMTDYFGYATGFKDFSSIKSELYGSNEPQKVIYMICLSERDQAVGFIYGEVKKLDSTTFFLIRILIIDPDFQHRGFGTYVVNRILNDLNKQYGPLTCIVAVSNKNKKGLSFWLRMGFTHLSNMEASLNELDSSNVSILKRLIK